MVLAYLERIWFSYAITKYMLICSTSTFNKYCMPGVIIGSMNALGGKKQTKVSPFLFFFFFLLVYVLVGMEEKLTISQIILSIAVEHYTSLVA